MRRARLAPALALTLSLALASPAVAADLGGDWVRSEARRGADREALEAEILRSTHPLPLLLRGLSRVFVRRNVRPTERYRLVDEQGVWMIHDLDSDTRWRADGVLELRENGDVHSHFQPPDRIHQSWRHGETGGTTEWHFDLSADALTITVTVNEARLPEPLRYTTHYERVPSP